MRGFPATASAILAPLCFWVLASRAPIERTFTEATSAVPLSGIQAQLAAREYRASESGEGLQAPNRAHNLRTYFGPTGIRIHDRTAAGSPELLRLSLSGVGRGGELAAMEPGTQVVALENRVEIRRKGLVEWFVNGPDGLEQGFTIVERPRGDGRLRLELALAGAQAIQRGEEVVIEAATGRKLAYGKLAVLDARGAPLAAEFALADADRIVISVDDAAAAYPIAIDPLLTGFADGRVEADQAEAELGASVASAGDVNGDGYGDVIVGAPGYDNGQTGEGAAFVFLGSASGIPNAGTLSAQTQLEGDQGSAFFGGSVASAGDVNGDGHGDVIVGAWGYDNGQIDEGAAFVFLGSATGVADANPATAHAQLEGNQIDARLGGSVASAGDVNGDGFADVIVGSVLYDSGQTDEGAAFVFLGSASGVTDGNPTTAHARLEGDQTAAFLGVSVASAGDVNGDGYADVIVGANGVGGGGTALVFLGSATGLTNGSPSTAHARLRADQLDQVNANLGYSVASACDVNGDGYSDVIVGAPLYDNGQPDEGAAFVFLGSVSGVPSANVSSTTAHAQLESNQPNANFGLSVACAGDVNGDGYADMIVGADLYDNGQFDEGAAFIYHGGSKGIGDGGVASAASRLESNQLGGELGASVASAGDVNGDGYDDVIVGAWQYDNGQANEGAAFIFHGSASGIPDAIPVSANTQLESNQADAVFGSSVASAGDVNGDGYGDVIVGAWLYDDGQSNEGAAFVFLGSATGVANAGPATAHARFESDQAAAFLGWSVASAGDVNGDGYSDVLVGARAYDDGQTDEGAAFVFLGSPSGLSNGNPSTAHARFESDQTLATLGQGNSVAAAGDVNGDGYADVIVGFGGYDDGQTDEGGAFVFHGSASGFTNGTPSTANTRLQSDQGGANLGFSVASAGDVNGDGFADVIVGAPLYDDFLADQGMAFVFLGSASGIPDGTPATAPGRIELNQASAELGWSVASAGDVNGDGYADLIVGSPANDFGQSNDGAAYVFLGYSSGVGSWDALLFSGQQDALLGESVASAGDVNGDGYADVIVGARLYDSGQADEGAAFVFQGGGNRDGRAVLARQRRGDGSGIAVQPWGGTHSGAGFAAELRVNHPQGSGRVKTQIEACPSGVPFGDASCANTLSSSWIPVNGTTPDVSISRVVPGLVGNGLYRWRARVLHAAATGTIPAHPAHGPWRRLGAQVVEADIRVPEPGWIPSLASGALLMAALATRRPRD